MYICSLARTSRASSDTSWGYLKVNFTRFFGKRGRFSPNVDKNVHERPPDTPMKGLLWHLEHRVTRASLANISVVKFIEPVPGVRFVK